jgi:hypothetical protein
MVSRILGVRPHMNIFDEMLHCKTHPKWPKVQLLLLELPDLFA